MSIVAVFVIVGLIFALLEAFRMPRGVTIGLFEMSFALFLISLLVGGMWIVG